MLTPEFRISLPNGESLSYEDLFSPFMVYTVTDKTDCYILAPNTDQEGLQGTIVVITEAGCRICRNEGWTKSIVLNVQKLINCQENKKIKRIDPNHIPTDIQTLAVFAIINKIQYQKI